MINGFYVYTLFPPVSESYYMHATANELSGQFNFEISGCCNGSKLQSSWCLASDSTWRVYSARYGPMQFSLSENYKCPLWTLLLQSLRASYRPGYINYKRSLMEAV